MKITKQSLRQKMRRLRSCLDEDKRKSVSERVCRRVMELEAWRETRLVALYAPVRKEVDVDELARAALRSGKRLATPRCLDEPGAMMFVEVTGWLDESWREGLFGVLEPPPEAPPISPSEIDLCVVPGLAFDHDRNRLGMGGGYYDRYLPLLRPESTSIGLCYTFQLVDHTPTDSWDRPMDMVAYETGIIQ